LNKLINGREKTNLPCKRIQVIYVGTSPSRRWTMPLPLKGKARHSGFLPKSTVWKGRKRITLQYRNLTNTTLARYSRSTSSLVGYIDSMYPQYDVIRMILYLCGFPPKTYNRALIIEKNIRQAQIEGHSTKYLSSTPQKQTLRSCYSQEEPKET